MGRGLGWVWASHAMVKQGEVQIGGRRADIEWELKGSSGSSAAVHL